MKYVIYFLFVTFFPVATYAQFALLTGRVYTEDGTAVSHVTLRIAGTAHTAVSDEQGRYKLEQIPFGQHRLVITSLEIELVERILFLDKPEHILNIPVRTRAEADISEVLIVERDEKHRIETSGFAVTVIETQEASLRNLTTNELLDRAVGIRVRQNGGVGSPVEYNLNGLSGSAVGIFIDGIESTT